MPRDTISDLVAFLAVARERSFTRAAAQLGVSPSALSHTIRALEARTGVRLLMRTTRSVAPTEAGERLLQTLAPRFAEIEAELAALRELREKPAGTIRITTTDYAADTILWPRLSKVLPLYPDLKVEIVVDYGMADIVEQRFDIGVRHGDQVAKDMIAVRIAPDTRFAIIGAPSYLRERPARGGLLAWELERFHVAIKEGIAAAIRLEPGVLVLYAVAEKESPTRIRVFEVYTDAKAYETHLQTPHFRKFRDTTEKMVTSRKLLDAVPIALGAKPR